jgi:nucleotide-binding universal stress UspA family protein
MGTIVVGYDGSECAGSALTRALELARKLGDRVVVAYAAEPPYRSLGDELNEDRRALEEIGERVTAEAIARAEGAGVDVEGAVIADRPAPGLLRLAEQRGARMIVVGTSGESPFAGAILGSVPHKLLHRARLPVLVVPAADTVHQQ